jgi:hypothetical protein
MGWGGGHFVWRPKTINSERSWLSMSAVIQASTSLVQPCGVERLIDVSPLAPDGLGNLRSAHSSLAQGDNARPIESGRSALANPLRFRGVNACALPITDEAKLHFGDHAQHSDDHTAHRPAGVDGWLQHPHACPLLSQFVDEVENVARVPAQAVQLDHHEDIAGSNEIQDRSKLAATVPGGPRDCLGSNERAASSLELGFLGSCVLSSGGDAGIANQMALGADGRRSRGSGFLGRRSLHWDVGGDSCGHEEFSAKVFTMVLGP